MPSLAPSSPYTAFVSCIPITAMATLQAKVFQIDSLTEVPADVFESLLQGGKRAKSRGQHIQDGNSRGSMQLRLASKSSVKLGSPSASDSDSSEHQLMNVPNEFVDRSPLASRCCSSLSQGPTGFMFGWLAKC